MEGVPDGNHVTTATVIPSVDVTDHQSDVTPDHHSDVTSPVTPPTNQYYHKNEVTMPIHYGDNDVTPNEHNLKEPHYMSTINLNIKQSLENHSNLEVMSRNYRSTSRLNGEESPGSVKKELGVQNPAFEAEEPYSNGDVKSTFDHSKPYNEKPMTESVNLELINMKPHGIDVVGNQQNGVINEIPVKKDEDVEIGNPYDEYFVPVNEHRKYMRGEKLYVTVDKRNKKSRSKCLCWTVCLCVVIAALVIGILAAVGAIGVKEPIKEISARHFSGNEAPIKGAGLFGDVNVTSPEPPTTLPGLLFVPRALESVMVVDNLQYSESLAQKNSSEYQKLAESLAEQLKVTLFSTDYLKYGYADVNLKILDFRPGSVIVRFRVAWTFKPGIHNARDPLTVDRVRRKFQNVRERHDGYMANYHVTLANITMVTDQCQDRGCESQCQFDYTDSLKFVCTCPEGQQVGGDGKSCAEIPVIDLAHPEVAPEPEASPEITQVGQQEPEVGKEESGRPEPEPSPEPEIPEIDPTHPEVSPEPEPSSEPTQATKHDAEPEVEREQSGRPEPEPSPEPGILEVDPTHPEIAPEPEPSPETTQATSHDAEPEVGKGEPEGPEPEPSPEPEISMIDPAHPDVTTEPEASSEPIQDDTLDAEPEVQFGGSNPEPSPEPEISVSDPVQPEVSPQPEPTHNLAPEVAREELSSEQEIAISASVLPEVTTEPEPLPEARHDPQVNAKTAREPEMVTQLSTGSKPWTKHAHVVESEIQTTDASRGPEVLIQTSTQPEVFATQTETEPEVIQTTETTPLDENLLIEPDTEREPEMTVKPSVASQTNAFEKYQVSATSEESKLTVEPEMTSESNKPEEATTKREVPDERPNKPEVSTEPEISSQPSKKPEISAETTVQPDVTSVPNSPATANESSEALNELEVTTKSPTKVQIVGGVKPEVLEESSNTEASKDSLQEPNASTDSPRTTTEPVELTTIKVGTFDSPQGEANGAAHLILTSNSQEMPVQANNNELRVVTPAAEIVAEHASNELNSLFVTTTTEHPIIEHNMSPFLPDIENDTLISILHSDGNFIGHPYTNSEVNESKPYNLANDQLNHTNPLDSSREDVTDLSVQGLNNEISPKMMNAILDQPESDVKNTFPGSSNSDLPPPVVSGMNSAVSTELPSSTEALMVTTTETMLGDLKVVPTTLPDQSGMVSLDRTTIDTLQGLNNEISTKTKNVTLEEPGRDGKNIYPGSFNSTLPLPVISNLNVSAELPSSTEALVVPTTETMLSDLRAVPTTLPDQSGMASLDRTTTATVQNLNTEIATKTPYAILNQHGSEGTNIFSAIPGSDVPLPVVSNLNVSVELPRSTEVIMVATTESMLGDLKIVTTTLPDQSGMISLDRTSTETSQGLNNEITTKTKDVILDNPGGDVKYMLPGSSDSDLPLPVVNNLNGSVSAELPSSTEALVVPTTETMLDDLRVVTTTLPDQPELASLDKTTIKSVQGLNNEISTKTSDDILDEPGKAEKSIFPGNRDSSLPPPVVSNLNVSAELQSSTEALVVATTETMLDDLKAVPTTLPDHSGMSSLSRTTTATLQDLNNKISTKPKDAILDEPGKDGKNIFPGSLDSSLPPPVVSNLNVSAESPSSTEALVVATTETILSDLKVVTTTLPDHSEMSSLNRTTTATLQDLNNEISTKPKDAILDEPGKDGKNILPGSLDSSLPPPVVSKLNVSAEPPSSTEGLVVATTETILSDLKMVTTTLPDQSGLSSLDGTTIETVQNEDLAVDPIDSFNR